MSIFEKIFGSANAEEKPVEKPVAKMYEGTPGIMQITAEESPKQILASSFPNRQWPISGGWGYSQKDAVVIEIDNSWDGIGFEKEFIQYRTIEEALIMYRQNGQRICGFRFGNDRQSLAVGDDGKHYDLIEMDVTAFKMEDFEMLKSDWESHNAYKDDEEGKQRHLSMAETKKIRYTVMCWFDISHFFGK